MTKRALISVSDKTGIVALANNLVDLGWEIISTGGTKASLDEAGVKSLAIEEVTGFPEMMDGRVKTLHPLVHGGLLGRRDLEDHMSAMAEHGIQPIDLVVVNLYPFKETLLAGGDYAEMVEKIDIGGPSMLRSAAKNHASVTVLTDPDDYALVLDELSKNGETSFETRQKLAGKVFRHTASYDALIASYLTEQLEVKETENLTLTYQLNQTMRYGENNHQSATFYESALPISYSIAQAKQLNGKALSFNNIRDADAAIKIARDFLEMPTVVALKHMNPCGIGQASTIGEAWDFAYEADPVSIFGGIIVLNREVDAETAQKMHEIFLEIIIAPSYSPEALEILTTKKKNMRILELDFSEAEASKKEAEVTGVLGGILVQEQDVIEEEPDSWEIPTAKKPTATEFEALKFAWKAVKFVKSNGIIVTNDHQTLGVGPGQTNRVASVKIALEQATEKGLDNAVLGSDAFFPFADNIEVIAEAGVKAIVQPGGSVRDDEVIAACDKHGIAMVFTGIRHFRH
ncbi:bifunctional phosphoribosylaminoimidazolecarboxamide formyltransferase/IMP cyclohydrolase [Lactococcus termiticola]|uniref:Bifunctional purine biosynthesis protein PurH n=1 Tax=Lactococcus termiticola TaxID=2169526 RepID=A0A2R5HDV3_9LACT|nr:bifunctional phosphoribosylaminoimidazolecarboxamide formyltransferase/IMP cyclohydrolase [Lactococcus termiticola]GBG96202.1 bifunctional phosphoribosylaminoimidazolecarboxamide formyltransferase / IMP cyclohydrolase [Lactococcus termiticola]